MRTAIMRLRDDPKASALMAGAFTRNNATQLASAIGRQPSEGELYIAHFLGYGGAAKLIATASKQPQANAAQMFPRAAGANRSVFYNRQGNARSVAGVYGELNRRYQMARTAAFNLGLLRGTIDPLTGTTSKLASASASAESARLDPTGATEAIASASGGPLLAVPDPAGTTQALAAAHQAPPQTAARGAPLFQSMFSDRGGEPVTPAVRRLWSTTKSAEASQAAAKAAAAQGQLNSLDLFVDHPRDPRLLFGNKKA